MELLRRGLVQVHSEHVGQSDQVEEDISQFIFHRCRGAAIQTGIEGLDFRHPLEDLG